MQAPIEVSRREGEVFLLDILSHRMSVMAWFQQSQSIAWVGARELQVVSNETRRRCCLMRFAFVLAAILGLILPYSLSGSDNSKPVKSITPLSADEIAVYKAILRTFSGDKDAGLNVSAKTYPLDPRASTTGFDQPGCLNGIQLDNLSTVSHSYHELPPEVLPSKAVTLVDPKMQARIVHSNDPGNTIRKGKPVKDAVAAAFTTGLFSMSEIAFDKEHRFAAVRYSFWCGSLCGHGSTLMFEKVNGEWRKVRDCGGWVS